MTLRAPAHAADVLSDPATDTPSAAAPQQSGDVLRVERGQAGPEELAAVTAVLLARAAATSADPAGHVRPKAGWRRLERERGFHAPHSWRV